MSSPPPTWQFACAAYIPLLTGHLSVIGSSLIIYSMIRGGLKSEHCIKQLKHPQNRILLVMSCYDFVYSLVKAWTFLLAPTGYGVPGAQGNLTTCAMQGFFIQLAPVRNFAIKMLFLPPFFSSISYDINFTALHRGQQCIVSF